MYYEAKGLKASGFPPPFGRQCVTAWWSYLLGVLFNIKYAYYTYKMLDKYV
nr:MAG TPA: hypothetical protein [Caudoviricetes sp.]